MQTRSRIYQTAEQIAAACAVALLLVSPVVASQAGSDNTSVNKRDRNGQAITADQQNNSKGDLDITKQIRSAIVADKALSSYAHNIKVVTQGGIVTLKGPVRSEQEKTEVEAKAASVAGAANVHSEISIARSSTHPKAKH